MTTQLRPDEQRLNTLYRQEMERKANYQQVVKQCMQMHQDTTHRPNLRERLMTWLMPGRTQEPAIRKQMRLRHQTS